MFFVKFQVSKASCYVQAEFRLGRGMSCFLSLIAGCDINISENLGVTVRLSVRVLDALASETIKPNFTQQTYEIK
jgi:hypothetical protein